MLEKHNYIKTYNAKIITKSPLFIGSDELLTKKEFINQQEHNSPNSLFIFPDWKLLYKEIKNRNLYEKFTDFFLDPEQKSLYDWLKNNKINNKDFKLFGKYAIKATGLMKNTGTLKTFIKNGLGEPYIPGSSLKGYIRSALLAWEIAKDPQKFTEIFNSLENDLNSSQIKLEKISATKLENLVFNTLNNNKFNIDDGVNCNLSGLIVGDSSIINTKDLVIYQREDLKLNKETNKIPLLLECVRENLSINIPITIDSTRCPYSIEEIKEAIKFYASIIDDLYLSYYQSSLYYKKEDNSIFLGGNIGYSSKTVVSALCSQDNKLKNELICKIINSSSVMKKAKFKFTSYPRVCHCIKKANMMLPIGHCTLSI